MRRMCIRYPRGCACKATSYSSCLIQSMPRPIRSLSVAIGIPPETLQSLPLRSPDPAADQGNYQNCANKLPREAWSDSLQDLTLQEFYLTSLATHAL